MRKRLCPGHHFILLAAVLYLLVVTSGCAGMRNFALRHGDPLAGAPKPRWADDPQVEEVVDHLNRNVDKLQAWRANSVKIRANNIPLSGTLAVERGNHLRLVVNSIAGNEVDMGSNDELFWIWAKRMPPPEYVYCRHEHAEEVRQAMGIPFEPEWLMQALGVERLKAEGTKLEIEPTARQARLVQQVKSAHGHPMRKVMLIDLQRGVIMEHSVYDYHGQRIAVARLEEHHLDKPSGAVLPRRVKLDWPQSDMSLVMNLGQIEVNPRGIPSQIWDMPKMPGYQMVDLGAVVQPGTRLADNRSSIQDHNDEKPMAPVEFLPPEFDIEDNAGRVTLTNDTSTGTFDEPIQQSTAPGKRPLPRDWWDE